MQPYKFIVVKNNHYEFTTATGSKYACYFLSYAEYFSEYKVIANKVYSFNVDLLTKEGKASTDPRIGYTIVKIIKIFLAGLTNAVVYVCDTSDSRELMRKRKFDSWFKQYDDGSIIKIDGHISTEGFDVYNAILIHKDNPKKNIFIEAFNDLNNTDDSK